MGEISFLQVEKSRFLAPDEWTLLTKSVSEKAWDVKESFHSFFSSSPFDNLTMSFIFAHSSFLSTLILFWCIKKIHFILYRNEIPPIQTFCLCNKRHICPSELEFAQMHVHRRSIFTKTQMYLLDQKCMAKNLFSGQLPWGKCKLNFPGCYQNFLLPAEVVSLCRKWCY